MFAALEALILIPTILGSLEKMRGRMKVCNIASFEDGR